MQAVWYSQTGPARQVLVHGDQPDPELELSYGRTGAGGITLVAVFCALIIGVVLWGLNSPAP